MKRKLIATLLVLGMMLTFAPMTIFSTSAETLELRISTADELVSFATNLKNGTNYAGYTVYIEDDIDLTGQTWPLDGCYNSVFSGMIDGQGHTIKGVTWATTTYSYQGLFGAKIKGTTADFAVGVKNLTVTDVTVKGTSNSNGTYGAWGEAAVGGLFGKIESTTSDKVLFDNLNLNITVSVTGSRVGGMIGESRATNMTISNCIFLGTVSGTSEVGGLIGWQMDRNLTTANTVVSGSVTASGANSGGFFGQTRDMDGTTGANSTITECVFDGILTTKTATASAGGFVGKVGAQADSTNKTKPRPGILTIQDSAFYGTVKTTVTTNPTHIGGFVGATNGSNCNSVVTLNRCVVAGELTASGSVTYNNTWSWARMTVGVVGSGSTVNVSNVVGDASGALVDATCTNNSTGAPSGVDQKPGNAASTVTNALPMTILDGADSAKFSADLDLSDTFVATTATKPLPMGVVNFYADQMGKDLTGNVTDAYSYQTKVENGEISMRLIGLLKATDETPAYEYVGLEAVAIRKDGTTVKFVTNANEDATNQVYTSIQEPDKDTTAAELVAGYDYIFTVAVAGLQADGGVVTFVVRSFHEVDGVRTYDDTRVINFDPAKVA